MKLKSLISLLQSDNGIVIEKLSTKDTNFNLPNDFLIKKSYRIIKWKLIHHKNNLTIENLITGVFNYEVKIENNKLTNNKKDTINWIKENIQLF